MRTPEVHYFKHEYVKFKKLEGVLHYQIWEYDSEGMMSGITESGVVRDEQHLKTLLNLGSVVE